MSKNIYAAICAAMREVGSIPKSQKNAQQGFSYRSIDQVYNRLQPVMAKHGIFTAPEVLEMHHETGSTRQGGVLFHLWSRVKYTFYAEDGSSIEVVTIGESMDSGDKSGNKAMAAAHKYALVQLFNIPFENMDPDAYTPEWVASDSDRITLAQHKQLKADWWATVSDQLKDEPASEREKQFASWVHEVTSDDFNAVNWREWTKDNLSACSDRLSNEAAITLEESGLS